jgi:uncharacterized repeat protein (TIGR02543 family)
MGSDSYTVSLDDGSKLNASNSEQGGTVYRQYQVPGEVRVPETAYISYSYVGQPYNQSSSSSGWQYVSSMWANTDGSWIWEAPELEGFEFVGWYTIDDSYAAEPAALTFSTLISTDRVTTWAVLCAGMNNIRTHYSSSTGVYSSSYTNYLRLVYRGKKLRVMFRAEGGELDDLYREVRRLEPYGELPVPSRPGYTFGGWFTEPDGGELVAAETVVTAMEDHALFARWDRVPVAMTVHFVGCGGEVEPVEKTVTSGEPYGELPSPVRDGCEFKGWYTASLGGSRVSAETIVGQTWTHWLYAQWKSMEDPEQPPDEEEPKHFIGRLEIIKKETE